jgi:hypothetical protein
MGTEWSTPKVMKQYEFYKKDQIKKGNTDVGKCLTKFIFSQLSNIFNRIDKLKPRRNWVILHFAGQLRLTCITIRPQFLSSVFDLATEKYWQYEHKDKAKIYMESLAKKNDLEVYTEIKNGILD